MSTALRFGRFQFLLSGTFLVGPIAWGRTSMAFMLERSEVLERSYSYERSVWYGRERTKSYRALGHLVLYASID